MLENLATRNKWAGDDVKMLIWRDGKATNVVYRLPKFDYSVSLVRPPPPTTRNPNI